MTNIQLLQEIDTRIVDFAPTTNLYAKSSIKFKGQLQFYNTISQEWFDISSATIHVTIKDRNNNILGEVVGVTSSGFLDVGTFETSHFYIPDYYANTDIVVEAKFEGASATGGGTFKPTDYYTIYHISDICRNVSSRTGECIDGTYNAEEIPFVPIVAFVAGVLVTGYYIKREKTKT
jgi:hypothetical protein